MTPAPLLSRSQDAEALLLKSPIDGRFLVRESTREKDTWVISLCMEGKAFHNKVC